MLHSHPPPSTNHQSNSSPECRPWCLEALPLCMDSWMKNCTFSRVAQAFGLEATVQLLAAMHHTTCIRQGLFIAPSSPEFLEENCVWIIHLFFLQLPANRQSQSRATLRATASLRRTRAGRPLAANRWTVTPQPTVRAAPARTPTVRRSASAGSSSGTWTKPSSSSIHYSSGHMHKSEQPTSHRLWEKYSAKVNISSNECPFFHQHVAPSQFNHQLLVRSSCCGSIMAAIRLFLLWRNCWKTFWSVHFHQVLGPTLCKLA